MSKFSAIRYIRHGADQINSYITIDISSLCICVLEMDSHLFCHICQVLLKYAHDFQRMEKVKEGSETERGKIDRQVPAMWLESTNLYFKSASSYLK